MPEYRIITDREYFKAEAKPVKGYYVDKGSVRRGVHSPEYYGYGFFSYRLIQIGEGGKGG